MTTIKIYYDDITIDPIDYSSYDDRLSTMEWEVLKSTMKYIKWKYVYGILLCYQLWIIAMELFNGLWLGATIGGIIFALILLQWGILMENDYKKKYPELYEEGE